MTDLPSTGEQARSRYLMVAGVVAYAALATAAVWNSGELLDLLYPAPGYYALGCLCLALVGLGMMIAPIARGRGGAVGLLVAGIVYALANVGLFAATISADDFAIFHRAYIAAAVFVAPALAIGALVLALRSGKRFGSLGAIGFALWVACVAFAHLWIVAAASASV